MMASRCKSLRLFAVQSLKSVAPKRATNIPACRFLQSSAARQFSSTATRFASGTQQELIQALENEIDAEKKLEQENLGGSSAPVITGFNIVTDGAEVRLSKTHGDENILVVFNVNHSVDVDEDFETEENVEQNAVPVSRPHFSIEVTKGSKRLCFEMELVETEDGQYDVQVEEFYIAPAAKGDDVGVEHKVYSSAGKFIDPGLHELLFLRYLEERGFTTDFCNQLVTYATHYEHSQYVNLLKNIKSFVSGSS
uniref:Uncharacterized protein n=1 Tax=Ditylenchus dipsaci TaxID=166011 RepID=A0A915DQI5_9BILA